MEDVKTNDSETSHSDSRRRFLKNIAKGAVYTTPIIMSMAITEKLYADSDGYSFSPSN